MYGKRFNKPWPFLRNDISSVEHDRIQQMKPFSVQCCWNGMVILAAQPFYDGMKFRKSVDECYASEISYMCNDLYAMNYTRAMIDPLVLVSYKPVDYYKTTINTQWYKNTQHLRAERIIPNITDIQMHMKESQQRVPTTWTCCSIIQSPTGNKYSPCQENYAIIPTVNVQNSTIDQH